MSQRKDTQNKMKREKIYVAGPLNADAVGYIKNIHRMIHVANELRKKGHFPYVPCLDFLLGLIDGKMEYDDYLQSNKPWIEVADAFYYIASSPGADKELHVAKKLGKKIYKSLDEVADVR